MENSKKKIQWLSVLQGYAVLLVAIGHVSLTDIPADPKYPIPALIETTIYSFHMALFIFISGYLFSYTTISKNLTYKKVLNKKLNRILYPYVFFTLITIILKYFASNLVKRNVEINYIYLLKSLVDPSKGPMKEFWFLMVIMVLFTLYPLFKNANKLYKDLLILTFFLFLSVFVANTINISIFSLSQTCSLGIYFFLGILSNKYKLIELLQSNKKIIIPAFILFLIFNIFFKVNVLTQLSGIFFSICLSIIISTKYPSMFSTFRDYLMQIYLIAIFFQMAIRWIYLKNEIENLYIPLYIVSIIIALYIPVLISKTLQTKVKNKFILKLISL